MAEGIEMNNGYIAHDGQVNIKCPKCGNSTFRSFAQSVPVNWTEWTFEYVCSKCGQIIGIPMINNRATSIQGNEDCGSELPVFRFDEENEMSIMTIGGKRFVYDMNGLHEIVQRGLNATSPFHRLEGERRRAKILELIQASPGITSMEIVEKMGEDNEPVMSYSRTRIYLDLDKLVEKKMVKVEANKAENGFPIRRFFPIQGAEQ